MIPFISVDLVAWLLEWLTPVTPFDNPGEVDFVLLLLLLLLFEITRVFEFVLGSPETLLSASSYEGNDFVIGLAPFDFNFNILNKNYKQNFVIVYFLTFNLYFLKRFLL